MCLSVRLVTDDNIIRRMRVACRIAKATDIHSEYVIKVKVKVQLTPEQATKAQRGSRDIALLFLSPRR